MNNNFCYLQYETAFMEVADKMETILANNHMGVIVQLCKGALRHGTKQKAFCKVKCFFNLNFFLSF